MAGGGEDNGGSLRGPLTQPPCDLPRFWLQPFPLGGAEELERQRQQLTAQERLWAEALPQRLQPRYAASRALLRQRLAPLLQCEPLLVPLHSPPGAPPALEAGAGFVSLSHSGDMLLLAWSAAPIGVDLEASQRPLQADALVERYFPPLEQRQLASLAPGQRPRAVLESWVRKEAAIKWCRGSLAADLRHWCWDAEQGLLLHEQQGWRPTSLCLERDGWLCGAAGAAVEAGVWG